MAESEGRKFPGCCGGTFLTAKAWRHTYTTPLPWSQRKRPHLHWFFRGHASLLNISAFVLVYGGKSFLSCKRQRGSRNRIRPAWKSHFPPGRISEHADNCSWTSRTGSRVILPVWNSCCRAENEAATVGCRFCQLLFMTGGLVFL